jgi:hypothetical protein
MWALLRSDILFITVQRKCIIIFINSFLYQSPIKYIVTEMSDCITLPDTALREQTH